MTPANATVSATICFNCMRSLKNNTAISVPNDRIERRDDGGVGRAYVADGQHVTRHTDRPAQQRAEHDHLSAARPQSPQRIAQTTASAHEGEKPCGAERIMEKSAHDGCESERFGRAHVKGHGQPYAEHDRVKPPEQTSEKTVTHRPSAPPRIPACAPENQPCGRRLRHRDDGSRQASHRASTLQAPPFLQAPCALARSRRRLEIRRVHGERFLDEANSVVVVNVKPLPDEIALRLLGERPHVPAPTRKSHVGEVVPKLGVARLATEIALKRADGLVLGELAAHHVSAEIARIIRHAGIFPVDQAEVTIAVDEEVQIEEIVVRQAHGRVIALDVTFQLSRLRRKLVIAGDLDRPCSRNMAS